MAYSVPNQQLYEETIHNLMHLALDQLIDIGAKLNLHSDILSTHDVDDDGNMEKLPDVHPERLLHAQLGIEGAEEEINTTQELIKAHPYHQKDEATDPGETQSQLIHGNQSATRSSISSRT